MLRIKELRMQNNLTQDELGKKINLTGKTIWAYENQIATPPLDVLIKLACAFSCSIDYLVGIEDDIGNITVIHQTDHVKSLSPSEQKLIDLLRKKPPLNATDWISLYTELPHHLQENIFAELKGMHLGYKCKNKKQGEK